MILVKTGFLFWGQPVCKLGGIVCRKGLHLAKKEAGAAKFCSLLCILYTSECRTATIKKALIYVQWTVKHYSTVKDMWYKIQFSLAKGHRSVRQFFCCSLQHNSVKYRQFQPKIIETARLWRIIMPYMKYVAGSVTNIWHLFFNMKLEDMARYTD